jgi:hypothetical protein
MCCGSGRVGLGPASAIHGPRTLPGIIRPAGLTFEYVGRTRMVVAGRATGRLYRFDHPGTRVEIDPRDSASISALPQLRRVGA